MNVHAYFPRHPLLKQFISYYYFLKTDDPAFEVSYYSFPNITTPLNIHQNIVAEIGDYQTTIAGSTDQNELMLIQGMRKHPLLVNLKGKLDKITIHFKPLGINQFIRQPFAEIAAHDSQLFSGWYKEPEFPGFIHRFYDTDDLNVRIAILEEFLIKIYHPLQIDPALNKAVHMIGDFSEEANMEQIAQKLNISVRTLERFFSKHIGISPVSFRKIARFRHSLHNKLTDEERKTLTDICYESNFYDQAYFINVYRQIAGANPKAFFKTLSTLADDRLVVSFLNNRVMS